LPGGIIMDRDSPVRAGELAAGAGDPLEIARRHLGRNGHDLAVIGRLYGRGVADWLAQLTEYDAHRDPSWDPFAVKAGLVE